MNNQLCEISFRVTHLMLQDFYPNYTYRDFYEILCEEFSINTIPRNEIPEKKDGSDFISKIYTHIKNNFAVGNFQKIHNYLANNEDTTLEDFLRFLRLNRQPVEEKYIYFYYGKNRKLFKDRVEYLLDNNNLYSESFHNNNSIKYWNHYLQKRPLIEFVEKECKSLDYREHWYYSDDLPNEEIKELYEQEKRRRQYFIELLENDLNSFPRFKQPSNQQSKAKELLELKVKIFRKILSESYDPFLLSIALKHIYYLNGYEYVEDERINDLKSAALDTSDSTYVGEFEYDDDFCDSCGCIPCECSDPFKTSTRIE